MNNTKWAELVEFMRRFSLGLAQHRIKDLKGPRPGDGDAGWDGEWYYHSRPHEWIEWMEIRCVVRTVPYKGTMLLKDTERVLAERMIKDALKARGIPYSIEADVVRIWGYLRPGMQVPWEHPATKG